MSSGQKFEKIIKGYNLLQGHRDMRPGLRRRRRYRPLEPLGNLSRLSLYEHFLSIHFSLVTFDGYTFIAVIKI